ncbi:hypothetical protein F5X99DRAFT_226287 [Biscogniauxia marginata]|nr:hypothetical protein F5X99DRAFT_226287 [Biscogniauxia marginata]
MAEPESFEDDLFADLYDDNDTSAAPAPAPAPASTSTSAPAPAPPKPQLSAEVVAQPEYDPGHGDIAPTTENGYDDIQEDNYEDDDDVDFNLGNGPSSNVAAPYQQEVSTPTFHTTRGPSAKEDG